MLAFFCYHWQDLFASVELLVATNNTKECFMADNVDTVIESSVVVVPTVIDVAESSADSKVKRKKKNHTDTKIDPNNPQTVEDYLSEFYLQSATQAPRKGYDQHWNKEGFIHAGPAIRLPSRGAANMIAFLFDTLADRATSDDATIASEAKAFLEMMVSFGNGRIEAKRKEKEELVIQKAQQIQESRNGNNN